MASLSQPPEIFVEGRPVYTISTGSHPEDMAEHILRLVGEALQETGVQFQVTGFQGIPASTYSPARVKFGIRLNGKDL